MSKKKLTPWFAGDVKPVRVGYYQRRYSNNRHDLTNNMPDYWDGEWIICGPEGESLGLAKIQDRQWRGLAVKHG